MRLTKTTLKEYLEADKLIKQLEGRKEEIRKAIIEQNKPEFEMGDFLIKIQKFTRVIPAHTQVGKRVTVKTKTPILKLAIVLFAMLLPFSDHVLAKDSPTKLQKYWSEFYPDQPCVMTQMFGFFITRSLGHNLYEMHTLASRGSRNAVLKMNTKSFEKSGAVINVRIRHMGQTEMMNKDGFSATYDLVEECI